MDLLKKSRPDVKRIRVATLKRSRSSSDSGNSPRKREPVNTFVIDNGAYTIKLGNARLENPHCIPNHIMKAKSERKRCFISDQIDDCRDLSGLYYLIPHERGYMTKFDVQKTIWDYAFHKHPMDEANVILTQPILNFKHVQDYMDEIFFEEYDVKSLCRLNATDLVQYYYANEVKGCDSPCLVVDSGYSFTHIVPYINGKKVANGTIRIDVGGKMLTNYLKDIISYRQLHVMEETYVINQLKEDTCFVSQNFKADMRRAQCTDDLKKNYVLPDFHTIRRGFVQTGESREMSENCQILRINNEQISVPEILMQPSIVPGMDQAGIAQCIAKSIEGCPQAHRKALADNIILSGGNFCFKGLKERLEFETRMFLPCHYPLSIYKPEDPISLAWLGGKYMSFDSSFLKSQSITKQEYEEFGSSAYTSKKLGEFYQAESESVKNYEDNSDVSYIQHWDNQKADVFQKSQMTHSADQNDVEFILEGENIDEYDGKYVTIEFECEKTDEPEVAKPVVEDTRRESVVERIVLEDSPPPLKLFKTKKVLGRSETLLLNPFTQTIIKRAVAEAMPSGSTLNSDIFKDVPQVNRSSAKVYKPVFRAKPMATIEQRATPMLTVANQVTLNGSTLIQRARAGKPVSLNSTQILNNTVLLPPNVMGAKNVTLQLIPFRTDVMKQTNSFIITKKPT